MSNPWTIKLKKTGILEKRLELEESSKNGVEGKQCELRIAAIINATKLEEYKNRQASLTVDAMSVKQGKIK